MSYASARCRLAYLSAFWVVDLDTGYQHQAETPLRVKTVVDNGVLILPLFTPWHSFLSIVRNVRLRNLTRFVLALGDSP